MSKTIVITSGYFNPLHPGHIDCFEACSNLGDEVRVIVNNDQQALQKTQSPELFQDEQYRMRVVSALKSVDKVLLSLDTDGSVCESIISAYHEIIATYGPDTKVIFGKGGDRFADNIPEVAVCHKLHITIQDGLGDKTHHSKEYRSKHIYPTI